MSEFMMNDALTYLSVIEAGSYAKSGKVMGVSPSVLSKRVTRLEKQLHVQLLHRTTRSLSMTEAGQLFYEHCKLISAQINDAVSQVSKHHQTPYGLLRVNAPMSFGLVHMMPAINAFIKEYPEIQIELTLGSQYANFIHNGLDIAIFIKDLPDTDTLCSRRIALRSTGLYASPEYIKINGMPNKPEDLTNHNCLIYQSGPGTQVNAGQKKEWAFIRNKQEIRIPVTGNLKVNSSQALAKAALADIGIVRLSSFMVTEDLAKGSLVSLLDEYCLRDIDIHAAYPQQRYVTNKVKIFIEFLHARFNTDQYWE